MQSIADERSDPEEEVCRPVSPCPLRPALSTVAPWQPLSVLLCCHLQGQAVSLLRAPLSVHTALLGHGLLSWRYDGLNHVLLHPSALAYPPQLGVPCHLKEGPRFSPADRDSSALLSPLFKGQDGKSRNKSSPSQVDTDKQTPGALEMIEAGTGEGRLQDCLPLGWAQGSKGTWVQCKLSPQLELQDGCATPSISSRLGGDGAVWNMERHLLAGDRLQMAQSWDSSLLRAKGRRQQPTPPQRLSEL